MDTVKYVDYRSNIKSGDLIACTADGSLSIRNCFGKLIMFVTGSIYDHVGIAWVMGGRVFIIEAVYPVVRIMPVSFHKPFYHVPASIDWKPEYDDLLLNHVGTPYSLTDCALALVDKTDDGGDTECAELCNKFYKSIGLDLGASYTPVKVVDALVKLRNTSVVKVAR